MILINKPIAVIADTSPSGKMIPLRFQIDAEEGKQVCQLKVKTIDKLKDKLVYRCMTQLNGRQREVELHYILLESRWILFNMR